MKLSRRNLLAALCGILSSQIISKETFAQTATPAGSATPVHGIDCSAYPGDNAVAALFNSHGNRTIGFYLAHSSNAPDQGWIANRKKLADLGFGFFPTYVGVQDDSPPAGSGTSCGNEAVTLMKNANFPAGSIVYHDIETPKAQGSAYQTYLHQWMLTVQQGGFYPGVYGSYVMAPWITKMTNAVWTVELATTFNDPNCHNLIPNALKPALGPMDAVSPATVASIFSSDETWQSLYTLGILAYDPNKNPTGIIRPGCIATQYKWCQTYPGLPLDPGITNVFDFDSSLAADPSNPASVAKALGIPKLMTIT